MKYPRPAPPAIWSVPLLFALLALTLFTATRFGLAAYAGLGLVPPSFWPGIIAKGLCFDLALVAVMISPLCLYEALLPNRLRASRRHVWTRATLLWIGAFILLFVAAAEATFWLEFSTRLNFIAVDYLLYTHEVIGNIRESYSVFWIMLAVAAAAAAIVRAVLPLIRAIDSKESFSQRRRLGFAAAALALPVLSLSIVDVDQMHGSGNAYADELSGNGLLTFAAAMHRNELDYDKFYRTLPQYSADAILKNLGVGRASRDKIPFKKRPKNVVLISVESLSASFLGAYGSTQGLTPRLDALARGGLKFERVFATGTRTVRGLEALSLGIPPIPGQSVVRRPHNDHLATLGSLLSRQGYSALFIYGGYGYFDNMNSYFKGNDYRPLDRKDFPPKSVVFSNIWGVADESLFENAADALDHEAVSGKPFFAHIMTTSNHRPYTYPAGRIDIPSPGGREGAVKYTDYAIGRFIDQARNRAWFKETLFVIVADHCASVAGKASLPVQNYLIPMLFYAPSLLAPGVYEPIVSQIDVAPTLIEILGKKSGDQFFGRSMFKAGRNPGRAFISNYQQLGYLRDNILTVLLPKSRVESFRVDPLTYAETPAPVDARLLDEAIAYYQTASRAFKSGALRIP